MTFADRVPHLTEVATDLADENDIGFDPMTILLIIQAIVSIVKLYQDCFGSCTANSVKGYVGGGGPVMQRIRRRFVSRHLIRTMGREEFDLMGGLDFVDSVFDYIEGEDIELIIAEALGQ
jgi:hypothetical protein